ncbi:MAG: hypothetical protein N4A44_03225 [Alphaproteobacteria bacterium]|jgi:hypothetical protein|nr:hypothetical protein [Alphaproteobacteria bacterium]
MCKILSTEEKDNILIIKYEDGLSLSLFKRNEKAVIAPIATYSIGDDAGFVKLGFDTNLDPLSEEFRNSFDLNRKVIEERNLRNEIETLNLLEDEKDLLLSVIDTFESLEDICALN